MNRSVTDINGHVLVVSQFTLAATRATVVVRRLSTAAPPDLARKLYEDVVRVLRASGLRRRNRRVSGDDARDAGQRWAGDDPDRQPEELLTNPEDTRNPVRAFVPCLTGRISPHDASECDRRGRRAGGGLLDAAPASAQQRPLITEDPLTVGNGRLLFEVGLDYEQDVKYPLSGLSGDLFSVPNLGISIGIELDRRIAD